MAKASLTLENGTIVVVEGTIEEIQKLIEYYGGPNSRLQKKTDQQPSVSNTTYSEKDIVQNYDLTEIVNTIKSCEQAEGIEKYILDRTNEANRVLLPLFIVYEYFDNSLGLTTSEISRVTIDLGVKVSRQNALRALKFSAKAYTIKSGNPPRYILNRRGIAFMRSLVSGANEEDTPSREENNPNKIPPQKARSGKKSSSINQGPRAMIKALLDSGFFTQKRTLSEIQKKLEEMGHIFAQTSLSGPVLKFVRDKKLVRTKENDVWLYSVE
jgi:hypothetical protein